MSDDNSMVNEVIALKDKLVKVEGQNAELKEKITELMKEIESMKMEKFKICLPILKINILLYDNIFKIYYFFS